MQEITIVAHNIISPLGFTSKENYANCLAGKSGIRSLPSPVPPYEPVWISRFDEASLEEKFAVIPSGKNYTRAEKLLILSIEDTLSQSSLQASEKELLIILSSTKGNIDLLDDRSSPGFAENRVHLWSMADTLQHYFQTAHKPLIVSNACISGVNALVLAGRLIRDQQYKHVLVAGVDLASKFVIAGFQSFKAMSALPCRPFDKDRDGINLGEGGASLLLTSEKDTRPGQITLLGGAVSNDANHISGPSRTGDGLWFAISNALRESSLSPDSIDALNAHGTATVYNDEMESKAFKLAGLGNTPMNSLKGYFGHTLGAAGLIETIISLQAMQDDLILPTLGYSSPGTPEEVNISNQPVQKNIRYLLKTASGFGGCNGAIILKKNA